MRLGVTEIEMAPSSSINLMSSNILHTHNSPQNMFFESNNKKSSIPSSYSSPNNRQIRIGIEHPQDSAQPPTFKKSDFITHFPFILFCVMKQVHVIYLIVISGFMLIRNCQLDWEILLLHMLLTLCYLCIQILARFFTFKNYIKQHYFRDSQYMVWNYQTSQWNPILQQNINVGQIIKIKQQNTSVDESSQAMEQLKIRMPVHILPLAVSSTEKILHIETFDIDKQKAAVKIPIIKGFHQYLEVQNKVIKAVKQKISEECLIQYTFSNHISESFQAIVYFLSDGAHKSISNSDIIPRGAYVLNQSEIVGVALYNLSQKDRVHLRQIIGNRNSITTLLQKHLLRTLGTNILITLSLLVLNAVITKYKLKLTQSQDRHNIP